MDNLRCEDMFCKIESKHIQKILDFYDEVPVEVDWLKDVSLIMNCLLHNLSQRPFGDYLKACLFYSCMKDDGLDPTALPDEVYIDILKREFAAHEMDGICSLTDETVHKEDFLSSMISRRSADRDIVFLLSFGLGMDDRNTSDFLTKVIRQSDFNFKEPYEAIYFYCLKNHLGYSGVKRYIEIYRAMPPANETLDGKSYTSDIEKMFLLADTHEKFVNLLAMLKASTTTGGYTKHEIFGQLLNRLKQMAIRNDTNAGADLSDESFDSVSLYAVEKYVYYSDTRNSENNMLPNSKSILKGKRWFLDTKLTRGNLSLMLSGKREITRNDIITLVFLNEDLWLGEIDRPYERFMDFQYTVNDYLFMCHFSSFFPENPYETFIGLCLASDNPQDTFRQIWSESFKEITEY